MSRRWGGDLLGPGSFAVGDFAQLYGSPQLGESGVASSGAHLLLQSGSDVYDFGSLGLDGGSELENQSANFEDFGGVVSSGDGNSGNEVVNDAGAQLQGYGSIAAPAVNDGWVDASYSGTLSFGAGTAPADDTGTFSADQGLTLDVGGTRTEDAGVDYAGAGTVDVTGDVDVREVVVAVQFGDV